MGKKWDNFLKEKDPIEKVNNENVTDFYIRDKYQAHQSFTFWSVFVTYAVYYIVKKQWTVYGSILLNDGLLSTSSYATIGLLFGISYGVSKFLTSPLQDTKSNRWLLGLGLLFASCLNLVLGSFWVNATATAILVPVILSCVLQVILGIMYSVGAGSSIRFLYNWFPNKKRRYKMIQWNVSHNLGSAIATFIILGSYTIFGEAMGILGYFMLPSIIGILTALFVLFFMKDKPEQVGLPPLKEYYDIKLIGSANKSQKEIDEEASKPFSYFFVKYVFKNKWIWIFAISNMLMYTMRMGLTDWGLKYLKDAHGYDLKAEGKWIYSMFDWGGLALTLIVGLSMNRWVKKFMPYVIGTIALATLSLVGIYFSGGNEVLLAFSFFTAGFIFIPQCFLPMMVSELSHWRVVSTASGVLGVSGYLGDTLMSKVIIGIGMRPGEVGGVGWDVVFFFLIACGIVAALLLVPAYNKKPSQ